MGIVQVVKQCKELIYLLSRLLATLIASYQMGSKPSLIYQQEQLGITSIEAEESSEIHLNLNQPPNQLQQQSTAPQSKKRKLSRFSKVTPSPDNELESYWEKKKLCFKFCFSNNKVCPSVSYLKY